MAVFATRPQIAMSTMTAASVSRLHEERTSSQTATPTSLPNYSTNLTMPRATDYLNESQRRGGLTDGPGRSEALRAVAGRDPDSTADKPPAGSTRSDGGRRDKGKGRADGRSRSGIILKLKNTWKSKPKEPVAQLSMVHFSDLAHRRDVDLGRYQCTHEKKFINDSDIYNRGGQLYSVYFYASSGLPARFEDVIICWDRACEVCSPMIRDSTAAPASGLPFVHLRSDTYRKTHSPLDEFFFEMQDPERGIEWSTDDIPRAKDEVVICNNGFNPIKVTVSVCDADRCRRCHNEDIDKRSAETKAAIELEKDEWNERQGDFYEQQGLPRTGHDYHSQYSSGPLPADNQRAAQLLPPPADTTKRPYNPLRMVHHHHLKFGKDQVRFEKTPHPAVFEKYFVSEEKEIYKFGGPAYRVTFPDGRTYDVMACTLRVCSACKKSRQAPIDATSPWKGKPFVHRRDLRYESEMRVSWFEPTGDVKYALPGKQVELEESTAAFRGEDGVMRETGCYTCVDEEGNCKECDTWQVAKDADDA